MRAEEFRIGNLILRIGNLHDVDWGTIKLCAQRNKQFNEDFKPIPLSTEWLERLGFRHERIFEAVWCWRLDHFGLGYHQDDGEFFLYGYQFDTQKIEYVHTLQNLYFALTGQDLTITP